MLNHPIIRKTHTKSHTVKIGDKQFITFEDYRSRVIGKHNKTWCNTVDLILDVKEGFNGYYGLHYTVQDTVTKEVRTHGTSIDINEVF